MPGIIVGMDGSAHSQWALEWAMNEAAARPAPLTVLSVPSWTAATYAEGHLNLDQAVEEVQALVDHAVSRRPGPALPVTVRVSTGSPAAELVSAARDADLLVVGARGSGGLSRRGVGSVSSQVAHEARCPVIIIFQPSTWLRAGARSSEPGGRARLAACRGDACRCLAAMIFSNDSAKAGRVDRRLDANVRTLKVGICADYDGLSPGGRW